jgi:hypothetical protein
VSRVLILIVEFKVEVDEPVSLPVRVVGFQVKRGRAAPPTARGSPPPPGWDSRNRGVLSKLPEGRAKLPIGGDRQVGNNPALQQAERKD